MNQPYFGACAVAAGLLCALGASASDKSDRSDKIVQFNGAIGSQPLAAGGAANNVRGIAPGGVPWVLRKLRASVDADGVLQAKGSQLLLGGGNNIGFPGIPRNVQATLICLDLATTPATPLFWNSVAAAVDEQGNFSIKGALTPAAAPGQTVVPATQPIVPPNPCNTPILLIRNSAAATTPGGTPTPGAWFAAGISGGDDD